jgi:hypothetical protein
MPPVKDLSGQQFGNFLVHEKVAAPEHIKHKCAYWRCSCLLCGRSDVVLSSASVRGSSQVSCGCFQESLKHGMVGTRTYNSWLSMQSRCKSHPHYVQKGITVCPEWSNFRSFLQDMGVAPSESHTIDRIDSLEGYYPENCRWATVLEQGQNKQNNHVICVEEDCFTIAEWARRTGLSPQRICARISRGWSGQDAVTQPLGTRLIKVSDAAVKRGAEKRSRTWNVTSPDGKTFQVVNLKKFCEENGLSSSCMVQVAKGTYQKYKGWRCTKITNSTDARSNR